MDNNYSIWLMPSESAISTLQPIISDLANKYNSPVFEPHLTLKGNILGNHEDIIRKFHLLCKKLHPIKFEFGEISFSTTYFQSVFIRIKANGDLMNAVILANDIFNLENSLFMPHISLLYGNFEMLEREKISDSISLPALSCISNTIVLTPAVPDPKNWKHLISANLK